jgi:hypothetical protein
MPYLDSMGLIVTDLIVANLGPSVNRLREL